MGNICTTSAFLADFNEWLRSWKSALLRNMDVIINSVHTVHTVLNVRIYVNLYGVQHKKMVENYSVCSAENL